MKCGKLVKYGIMPEEKPCYNEKGHASRCIPDLTGLKFGCFVVTGLGPTKWRVSNLRGKKIRQLRRYWYILDVYGETRLKESFELTGGKFRGKMAARGKGFTTKNGKATPEYSTVCGHWHYIFDQKHRHLPAYVGMPFHDEWDPNKGGVFWKGVKWILDNLGPRPSKYHSMDIIKHEVGFVPGNLRWTLKNIQRANQKHKTMFLLTIQQHETALRQLGYGIHKLKDKKNGNSA